MDMASAKASARAIPQLQQRLSAAMNRRGMHSRSVSRRG